MQSFLQAILGGGPAPSATAAAPAPARAPGEPPLVWVIDTPWHGDLHARLGIAEQLTDAPKIIPDGIEYAKTPQAMKEFLVKEGLVSAHLPRYPDVVIGSDESSPACLHALKQLCGNKTKTVIVRQPVLQNPVWGTREEIASTDLFVSYHHQKNADLPEDRLLLCDTIPHRVTPEKIAEGMAEWADEFSTLPKPVIGIIMGGNIANRRQFTPQLAAELGRKVNALAKENGGSVVITTSRRTTPETAEALCNEITVPAYIHQPQRSPDLNPYFGILGVADQLVATSDSISMCAEIAATGKPAYIFHDESIVEKSHAAMLAGLIKTGAVRLLEDQTMLEPYDYAPINSARQVADRIRPLLREPKVEAARG